MTEVLYFGCLVTRHDDTTGESRRGHGLDAMTKGSPFARAVLDSRGVQGRAPFIIGEVFGISLHGGWCPARHDFAALCRILMGVNPTPVRLWWLRRGEVDFSLAAMWDQTTDPRPGSVSVFIVEGHHAWPATYDAIAAARPQQVERIESRLGLGGPMYLWTAEGGINNGLVADAEFVGHGGRAERPRDDVAAGLAVTPRVLTLADFREE